MADRVHQLAQAVQVADLLADRIDQLKELQLTPRSERDDAWRVRLVGAMDNLARARRAYATVREPQVRT
jgi:phage-related baseplate assembly protein